MAEQKGEALAALDTGYLIRRLRTRQESVWSTSIEEVMDVRPLLEGIDRCMAVLSRNVSGGQHARYKDVRARLEGRHELAAAVKGSIAGKVNARGEYLGTPLDQLPEKSRAALRVWMVWQEEDWEELRVLTWKAVEGERRLEAWWEIGHELAEAIIRIGKSEFPFPPAEADWDALVKGISMLTPPEKLWVEDFLPITARSAANFGSLLLTAYQELRSFLPAFEKRRLDSSPPDEADDFVHSSDFRRCTWRGQSFRFSRLQAAMIKALHRD